MLSFPSDLIVQNFCWNFICNERNYHCLWLLLSEAWMNPRAMIENIPELKRRKFKPTTHRKIHLNSPFFFRQSQHEIFSGVFETQRWEKVAKAGNMYFYSLTLFGISIRVGYETRKQFLAESSEGWKDSRHGAAFEQRQWKWRTICAELECRSRQKPQKVFHKGS